MHPSTLKTLNPDLLMIFTRNPELGKCKTRLAKVVGDTKALAIYKFLLEHTEHITRRLHADKTVYYSNEVWDNDLWDNKMFNKALQHGGDLGQRISNAFIKGFDDSYRKIIVIGSDLYDLTQLEIEEAFSLLDAHDYVIGPAQDGGFYLLGMKALNLKLFKGKSWGTDTVLQDILKDLNNNNIAMMKTKNDVDIYEDIKDHSAFKPFLKGGRYDG